jgi:hypothetical protein
MARWKPSRSKAREFAQQMDEVLDYCREHHINNSNSMDSFYFTINDQSYRVSNHTIESSNSKATNFMGEQVREKYHEGRKDDTVYITASKTRLIEIHKNLLQGKKLDKRGNVL